MHNKAQFDKHTEACQWKLHTLFTKLNAVHQFLFPTSPHPPTPPTLSCFTFTKSDVDVVRPDLLAPFVQKLNTVKPVLIDKHLQDLHWCLFKRSVR